VRQFIALLDFQEVDAQRLSPIYADALLSTAKKEPTTATIKDPLVGTFMAKEEP